MMQQHLHFPGAPDSSLYSYGARSSGETHGVVLTKSHVVELILDLVDYLPEKDLGGIPLLEPSCGKGAFLLPAVDRLLRSAARWNRPIATLTDAIAAFDIDSEHVAITKRLVCQLLVERGVCEDVAARLSSGWIRHGDFLLTPAETRFGAVVGNPPYVRIEQIHPALQSEYRSRFSVIYDRADLYVAFIEHSLRFLRGDGVLGFICADRWTLNKYGAPLRRLIARDFGVKAYIDLSGCSPFESDVVAYPSIFAISAKTPDKVAFSRLKVASAEECAALGAALAAQDSVSGESKVEYFENWFVGDAPWVLSSAEHLRVLRDLERRFAALEADSHTRVGIGVATGCDRVYIVPSDADIEADRLVPLVMRNDLVDGVVKAAGKCVVNVFDDLGRLVELEKYPKLKRYLGRNAVDIRARHVARANPKAWYRTIDRVYPDLVKTPKLLVPDIAGANVIVLDSGFYHPHHNLYFVTSTSWDLSVLGALLSSRVALFFVWSYAVKMRGGYLRFQAQYLRRIRVPDPGSISSQLAGDLRAAFVARDFDAIDHLALAAYQLERLPEFDFVDARR